MDSSLRKLRLLGALAVASCGGPRLGSPLELSAVVPSSVSARVRTPVRVVGSFTSLRKVDLDFPSAASAVPLYSLTLVGAANEVPLEEVVWVNTSELTAAVPVTGRAV